MGLGTDNGKGKALLPPSPSVPHAGALGAPEHTHLTSSITPGCPCLVVASPCLPAPAEHNRESSVQFTVIWGCLPRNGHVMCVFKEERLKYLYSLPMFLSLPYFIPFRCIPKEQRSIPCVSSTPAGQWVLLHKPAVPRSHKLRFCKRQHMSISVQCIASLAEAQQQFHADLCLLPWPRPHLALA